MSTLRNATDCIYPSDVVRQVSIEPLDDSPQARVDAWYAEFLWLTQGVRDPFTGDPIEVDAPLRIEELADNIIDSDVPPTLLSQAADIPEIGTAAIKGLLKRSSRINQ